MIKMGMLEGIRILLFSVRLLLYESQKETTRKLNLDLMMYLNHMGHKERKNLEEDTWNQILDMWKNRRPTDYQTLKSNLDLDEYRFKVELMTDENRRLRLNVVPVLTNVQDNNDRPAESNDIVKDFQMDFHNRIVDLAVFHDEFEP
ncbi:hypothetical protein BG842_17725 [Haladaptatus sp. W1]|nr:hypothetical protein BG842_17725 [Haladaptatus sp. W1]